MNDTASMTNHSVAVFPTHDLAEAAVKALSESGYDMRKLSIIGQNYASEDHPVGFVNTGNRMLFWGKLGAFWGSIWGLLFGSAMIFVPGIGFIMFAGWLAAVLEGAALGGGIAAIGAALVSIGIPKDSVVRYESALKAGSFILIAHGSDVEVQRAKDILAGSDASQVDSYSTEQPVGHP